MIEKYGREFASRSELRRFEHQRIGPWGCYCQTLAQRLAGDGCSLCNPEYTAELTEEEEPHE
jgi:hypothetical protein